MKIIDLFTRDRYSSSSYFSGRLQLVYKKRFTYLWKNLNYYRSPNPDEWWIGDHRRFVITHKHYFDLYKHYLVNPESGRCQFCNRKANKKILQRFRFFKNLERL